MMTKVLLALLAAAVLAAGGSNLPTGSGRAPSSPGHALTASGSAPAPGSLTKRVSPLGDPRGIHPGLTPVPASQKARARTRIEHVRTAGQGPHTGYNRDQFGTAWDDNVNITWGHDGCKTRQDVLHRDLIVNTACTIYAEGDLADPYTGRTIHFTRNQPMSVQIDHVIALSYAWDQGASGWTAAKRKQLANDPLNLLAVDGPTNERKGDAGLSEWMPPGDEACPYAVRTAQVSLKYHVPIRAADKTAMLRACGS